VAAGRERAAATRAILTPCLIRPLASDRPVRAPEGEGRAPCPADGEVTTAASPILSTREVTIRFGGHVAVDHVSLDVLPATLKSIIGPNGAGKTTLFNLLSGQYRPSEGRIAFKGRDVTGWSAAARTRLGIGRSFQLTNIFPTLSVLENVRLAVQARRGVGFNAWRDYRSFPGLEDRAYALLETVLLESKWQAPAGELAHGEKRKLELGILLALEPEVLLLDEPTAGMSLEEVPTIIGLIERIKARRDKTILLVEHKIDMVMALSDAIAVLKDGRLIADGTPEAISENPEVQAAYFGGGVTGAG